MCVCVQMSKTLSRPNRVSRIDLQDHDCDAGAGHREHVLAQPVLDGTDAAPFENVSVSRLLSGAANVWNVCVRWVGFCVSRKS